ncbi:putative non-specific serine/threonine protein kinase [Dioscorea sansibarensis]
MKYMLDESVKIVDKASLTQQGILSTEKGQGALLSLYSHERSLIEVQENIFLESNDLTKSIHVILDALNRLRSCYIIATQYSFLPPEKVVELNQNLL